MACRAGGGGAFVFHHPQSSSFASTAPFLKSVLDSNAILWKEQIEGATFFRAEVFLICAVTRIPGSEVSYEEKFHIFIASFDEKAFASVQDIVRTLKKKENGFRSEVQRNGSADGGR
jgi:hypothetical protein